MLSLMTVPGNAKCGYIPGYPVLRFGGWIVAAWGVEGGGREEPKLTRLSILFLTVVYCL